MSTHQVKLILGMIFTLKRLTEDNSKRPRPIANKYIQQRLPPVHCHGTLKELDEGESEQEGFEHQRRQPVKTYMVSAVYRRCASR